MFLVKDSTKRPIYYNLDLATEIEETEKAFLVTLPTGTKISVDKGSVAAEFVNGFIRLKLQGRATQLGVHSGSGSTLYQS